MILDSAAGHPGRGDHAAGVIATGGDVKPAGGNLINTSL